MRKTKSIVFILVIALIACLAVGCNKDNKPTDNDPSVPDPVYEVELNKTELTLQVGQAAELIATPVKDGLVDKDAVLDWESSDNQIATVSGGTVTAVKAGNAVITVTYQGKKATANVKVEYTEPAILLSQITLSLASEETQTLTVKTVGNISPTSYEWS